MRNLFNKQIRTILLIVVLIFAIFIDSVLLIPFGQSGIALLLLTIIVGAVGIVAGPTLALGLALILYFIIGSLLFWLSLSSFLIFEFNVPLIYILVWMVLQLAIAVITGRISIIIKQLISENEDLKDQLRTLVAVDSATGFDNKERMLIELEMEHSRSRRHEHTYSFLLIKQNYFDQFRKLYGDDELNHLVSHISRQIYKLTRFSDLKFRPRKDLFAVLLTDTPIENIEVVIEKMERDLEVLKLKDNKLVTLSFDYGYIGYEPELKDAREIYEQVLEQVDPYA